MASPPVVPTDKNYYTSSTCRVRVTLEISGAGGSWDNDCPVWQIHKQAIDGAIGTVRQIEQKFTGVRLMGTPEVEFVTHKVDKIGS